MVDVTVAPKMTGEGRSAGEPVHVFWTGGWDSTFRVLQLSVEAGRSVQPHYLVDLRRRSTLQEMNAMHQIRRDLARMDSEAAARVRPLALSIAQEVPRDPGGLDKLNRLRKRVSLFRQYDFLTSYAARSESLGLEIGFTRDDHRPRAALDGMVEYVDDDGHGYWQLDRNRVSPDDDLSVFRPLRFPLLALSKVEMREKAEAMGVRGLMDATWLCHNPGGRDRNRPCGRCAPCTDAMQKGMRHRFPAASRARYHLRKIYALGRPLRIRYEAMTR